MSRWVVACLLVVAVVLGGELIYYLSRPPVIKVSFRAEDVGRVVPPPVVKKAPEPVARPKVAAKPPAEPSTSVDVEAIPAPPRMVAVSPDDIKVGMKKDELQSTVGEPFMRSYTSEDGQLLEVDVFPGKTRGEVTVARILDGKVISSYARVH
jgi:hypothetical protein